MSTPSRRRPVADDVLVPSAALLPLSDSRGGRFPVTGGPGSVRSLCASLGVVPIQAGKHDTTASRWYEDDPTQKSDDGRVVTDSIKVLRTDT